jgi:MHS family proline/betaine transporter-like MFS transporter
MKAASVHPRNVVAAIAGNTLEWFDILVYAYFVEAIASAFFPADDANSALLLAYGTFGLSFVARPLGGVVLGRIADRSGRRVALVYSSIFMCFGTLLIAVLPSYSSIGLAAPLLLLLARLIQGFSAGGEFGSATAFLAEQSTGRRAFLSSWQFASQGLGMLLAALTGLALGEWLSPADMAAWGWRMPFLMGALIGPVAYYIRRNADETEEFLKATPPDTRPATGIAARFIGRCAIGTGAVLGCTVTIYFLVYIPGFARTSLQANSSISYSTAMISGATLLIGTPLSGLLADRMGPLRLGVVATAILTMLAYPIFASMVASRAESAILLGQFSLSLIAALYLGALPAILANLFDTQMRSLGLAISYNVAVMTGGGFAQLIFALLVRLTGALSSPGYYVVLAGAVSLLSLWACRRVAGVDRLGAPR